MKLSELKCPWGCKDLKITVYESCKFEESYAVEHDCKVIELCQGKEFKTKQGAMKNWNSWLTREK